MERLTERFDGWVMRKGCHGPCRTCDGVKCTDIYSMIDRLAAYEDTGLEPEEIKGLIARALLGALESPEMEEYHGSALERADNLIEQYEALGPLEHIKELIQAEKNGRLVVLPCKVGDTVYIIRAKRVIILIVESIHKWTSGKWKLNAHTDKRYPHWFGYEVSLDGFGKTAFLTREEAEAALKKREEAEHGKTGIGQA